jgi:hypothetical protein
MIDYHIYIYIIKAESIINRINVKIGGGKEEVLSFYILSSRMGEGDIAKVTRDSK